MADAHRAGKLPEFELERLRMWVDTLAARSTFSRHLLQLLPDRCSPSLWTALRDPVMIIPCSSMALNRARLIALGIPMAVHELQSLAA